MRTVLKEAAAASRTELVAVLVPEGARPVLPDTAPPADNWKPDFGEKVGSTLVVRGERGLRWALVRVPARGKLDPEAVRVGAAQGRLAAEELKRTGLIVDLSQAKQAAEFVQAAAEGAGMAGYDHAIMKATRKTALVKKITLTGVAVNAETKRAAKQGSVVAEANLYARELQNAPANVLTPKEFAVRARKVCRGNAKLSIKVLGRRQLAELGAGSLLGVSQASVNEPQLVHMVYKPAGKSKGKIALVGKGLTFDTGGVSLKPGAGMEDMKFDMSGAAAVLGAFHGLANGAECDYEVHGILGCVENAIGGNAQRPGDIVTAMNGLTIEVLNTDAEGRLVLADCLAYVDKKVKPERIYDIATLTGAAIHALGHLHSAVISNNDKLAKDLMEVGARAGESYWQLPFTEQYRDLTRGQYADLQNIYNPGEGAGTIAGGCFLSFFIGERDWVHLDIAATAWKSPARPYLAKGGGSGVGTRTFLELLRS
jgi:leucyl aminopeptidase